MTRPHDEMPPLISIVIAVLNAADDVELTLQSIAEQAHDGIEIVVMDGGSTDGTLDVVRSFDLPIALTSESDGGIYDAMNKGAAAATGKWLHFLNAGDVFTGPGSLTVVAAGLERAQAEGRTWLVAGARYVGGEYDGQPVANLPHRWYRHALGIQPHCHQATWFRSDLFSAMGGYSLDFGFVGDFDLIMRWGLTGPPEAEPSVVIDYARGGTSDVLAAEIPALLRRVRIDRLQLGRVAPALDISLPAIRFLDRSVSAVRRRLPASASAGTRRSLPNR